MSTNADPVKESHLIPLALVVHPQADNRALCALSLEGTAEEIDEAVDGADALAHALARPPQLVLTELRMPRIDGFALCGLLRKDPATQDATILVVTASASPGQIERARHAGADDVLVKPVDPTLVRERARLLVCRSRELRAASQEASRRVADQLARSRAALARGALARHRMMSRTYVRQETVTPPIAPPDARCPRCDRPLAYMRSFVGGVSAQFREQWDHFMCESCGDFEYRHRTRRIKKL